MFGMGDDTDQSPGLGGLGGYGATDQSPGSTGGYAGNDPTGGGMSSSHAGTDTLTGLSLERPESTPATPVPAPSKDPSGATRDANGNLVIDPATAFQGGQGASTLFGQLSRAQWEDWRDRFAPYISQLGAIATDKGAPGLSAQQAMGAVGDSFASTRKGLALNQSRLGMSLSPEEKALQARKLGLSEAATKVKAANESRIATQDRQQQILAGSGGLSNVPTDQLMQQGG